jgi:signal peptidase II
MQNPGNLSPKARAFWPALIFIYLLDFVTKRMAEEYLAPMYVPHRVVGDFIRLTLAYNKDAAMGLSLGGYSRMGFALTAAAVLVVLGVLYRKTPETSRLPALALAAISAGALGNLTDRLMSSRGVVDFIDIGTTSARFWTFNVADMGVTCGAILLALISLREDRARNAASASKVVI